jgi:hypothetical protein
MPFIIHRLVLYQSLPTTRVVIYEKKVPKSSKMISWGQQGSAWSVFKYMIIAKSN